jgi:phenylalanyl-tRNA synthetase beta chain
MRVPLSWLKDFVDIPESLSVEELAERLTIAGLEVGKIDYIGLPQSHPEGIVVPPSDHLVWQPDKIVLGFIHEVKPHPDADRLVLAMVDHGTGEIEQIVTGAPNLYPYKGQVLNPPLASPIAREGAEVYDGHSDEPGKRMILKEKKIRGIPNKHMVCSELELGLSGEHEGVLLLDYEDYKQYAPGTPLVDVLSDVILDIELTPNMARNLNILGIAREIAALLDVPLREPDYWHDPKGWLANQGNEIEKYARIEIREPQLNPRFTAALLQNVEIKASPDWLQRRLKLVGQRPINNIVDVTNYVMFEIGQPTHAFDYDILKERAGDKTPVIITRLPESGERLTTLDGTEHVLKAHNLLVADEAGALSMGGVMGGLESEIQDPAQIALDAVGISLEDGQEQIHGKASARPTGTQTVLLEAAAWNFINIRKTVSSTKLNSEASARFSRGVHPEVALRGLVRGAQLMVETSGATLVSGILDAYPNPAPVVVVDLTVSEVTRLLGFEIPKAEVSDILQRLGFKVEEKGESLHITAPDHRLDIGTGTIGQADLIEEIARIYGYNRLPNTQIGDVLPIQRTNPSLEREENARDILVAAGLREIINYRLTTPERESLLAAPGQDWEWDGVEYITLANPISTDKTVMRHTLLAGLLEIAERNSHFQPRQAIFEVGKIYLPNNGDLPLEPTCLGIVLMGQRQLTDWQHQEAGVYDFYDLKGVVTTLLDGLRIPREAITVEAAQHASFHPGRSARLRIHDEEIGIFGEIHPIVRDAFGIVSDAPLVAAEFNLDRLLSFARPAHPVKAIPTQPAVYQDISLVLDRTITAAEVERTIWNAGGNLLVGVQLFDIYMGEQIPAGKKSLAYSLTYQHPEETLTDKKVAKVHQRIVSSLEHQLGAQLRA